MKNLSRCGECRERTVSPTVLESYSAPINHCGVTYDLIIYDIPVRSCTNCGEIIPTGEFDRKLSEALREAANLLHPQAIQAIRDLFPNLHDILNVGESQLDHWITGRAIQSRDVDDHIRRIVAL